MVNDLIEVAFTEERVPLVNGIIFPAGRVVLVDIRYDENNNYYLERDGLISSSIEELKSKGEFEWVFITSLMESDSDDKKYRLYCGEGAMGGDGFVALYSNVEQRLLWIAFFEDSNPFIRAEIRDGAVIAESNLWWNWIFPIDRPENIKFEKVKW